MHQSAMQPSPTEKSSRMTLHYIMQNDGACPTPWASFVATNQRVPHSE